MFWVFSFVKVFIEDGVKRQVSFGDWGTLVGVG